MTLRAAGADALIVRHPASGAAIRSPPWTAGQGSGPAVINAGDGTHEHPTQALLDALTLRQRLGGIEGKPHRDRRRHPAQPGRPVQRAAAVHARCGGGAGRAADPVAGRCRDWPVRCRTVARRRTSRSRRGADAAGAGRADERRFLPVGAGVLDQLRTCREAARAAARACRRPASRADAARHGDRVPGRRLTESRRAAAGYAMVCMCGWRCCSGCLSVRKELSARASEAHGRARYPGEPRVLIRNVLLYGEGEPHRRPARRRSILAIGPSSSADADAEVIDAPTDPASRFRRPAHPSARART